MRPFIPALLLCAACAAKQPALVVTPQDLQLHRSAVVVDTHADTTEAMFYEGYDLFSLHAGGHLDAQTAE